MQIVVAPDAFKETLTADAASRAIADGLLRVYPAWRVDRIPLADGGEGTATVLIDAFGGHRVTRRVTGPSGDPIDADFAILGDGRTAVVEVASASGLERVPPEHRDPGNATSRGTGELIRAALDLEVTRIIVALGGSATVDAGAGAARALGIRFLDATGSDIPEGGLGLQKLERIDRSGLDPRIHGVRVDAACDVDNPLLGPDGAARVFAPQKGADPDMVRQLEAALAQFADVIRRATGARVDVLPRGGAAGGLGAGLFALLNATLEPGMDLVMEAVGLRSRLENADLVITGEGRLDAQTSRGKVPAGVARVARAVGIPIVAIGGSVGENATEALHEIGLDAWFSALERTMDPATLKRDAYHMLADCAEQVARLWKLAARISEPARKA